MHDSSPFFTILQHSSPFFTTSKKIRQFQQNARALKNLHIRLRVDEGPAGVRHFWARRLFGVDCEGVCHWTSGLVGKSQPETMDFPIPIGSMYAIYGNIYH